MTAQELRQRFIDFFVKQHGHQEIKSASVIPENDPTVLFTTAGMHPLVPYLMGEKHPAGKRLVDVQKCIRTDDIDDVGDSTHCTFFEMLGNWSLGDYFKKEAIKWSFEFLTDPKWLGIDKNKLAVSVFEGDSDAPFDQESYGIWKSLGIAESRIARLGKKDNWWGPAGVTGPCGPDTEMFYWTGADPVPEKFDPRDKLWVEIWNDVFMEYYKKEDGTFEPLKQKNVDTGMGLERMIAVLQGKPSHYETELFLPIIKKTEELGSENGSGQMASKRIIADHMRAATFILGDPQGVAPSNTDQGYILRRLIRRTVRHGKMLGIQQHFTHLLGEIVVQMYDDVYPELVQNRERIITELQKEEAKFQRTLEQGLREMRKIWRMDDPNLCNKEIAVTQGDKAFYVYETYGFPLEMIGEELIKNGFQIDTKTFREKFNRAMKAHQQKSRAGSEKKFHGGLADHSEECTMLHTATHLLHQALKTVLGNEVNQKGSNITAERLRFDFNYPQKMTPEQLQQVEKLVNKQIERDLPVSFEIVTVDEAKRKGAIGLFEERYGDQVKVYKMGDFSYEICGGPHVANTGILKHFKITREEACSAGIRRIKAVVGVS